MENCFKESKMLLKNVICFVKCNVKCFSKLSQGRVNFLTFAGLIIGQIIPPAFPHGFSWGIRLAACFFDKAEIIKFNKMYPYQAYLVMWR